MFADDDLLALSGLQHVAYCERQWALIHLEQEWKDSFDTVRGELFHKRVDIKGYTTVRGFRAERRVRLVSKALGIYGVADIVEYGSGENKGRIRPVEYKVGRPKVEDWDRIQVTAQVLCLEEMSGASIEEGILFYGETRRREVVPVTDTLRARVANLAQRMRELFEAGKTPFPLKSHKCSRCSLREDCLPELGAVDVSSYLRRYGIC